MAGTAIQLRTVDGEVQALHLPSTSCSCDLVMDSDGQAYNEEAFRYFLEIERKRAEVSNRPLLLMLVDFRPEVGGEDAMPSVVATKLFSGLSASLRETDFLGWYREERVAGAVLVQRADSSRADVSPELTRRVSSQLAAQLSPAVVRRLQVRVFQLPSLIDETRHEQVLS